MLSGWKEEKSATRPNCVGEVSYWVSDIPLYVYSSISTLYLKKP